MKRGCTFDRAMLADHFEFSKKRVNEFLCSGRGLAMVEGRPVRDGRALVIVPVIPDPTGTGGEQRAWNHLRSVATLYDTDIIIHSTVPPSERQEVALREISQRYFFIPCEGYYVRSVSKRVMKNQSPSFMLQFPNIFGKWEEIIYNEYITDCPLYGQYAIILVYKLNSMPVFGAVKRKKIESAEDLLDIDDIESEKLLRQLRFEWQKFIGKKFIRLVMRVAHLRKIELKLIPYFSKVFVCSDLDKNKLEKRLAVPNIRVLPNSVNFFPAEQVTPLSESQLDVLFVGALTYPPNAMGIERFATRIWPTLYRRLGGRARLLIVGRRPPKRMLSLVSIEGVSIHADVPDLKPFYDRARVAIVPIRSGGGTRIKIIEALAYGRPVVSTTVGAEGLNLVAGRDILIADNTRDFIEAIERLCTDISFARKLAEQGRTIAQSLYSTVNVGEMAQSYFKCSERTRRNACI